jgi:cation transport ATPase
MTRQETPKMDKHAAQESRSERAAATRAHAPLQIPLALVVVALFLLLAFQSVQLFRQRENLIAARATQSTLVEETNKLRLQLDGLVEGALKLADGGNASAKAAIADLQRQGITLNTKK